MTDELDLRKVDELMALLGYLDKDELTAYGKYDGGVSARTGGKNPGTTIAEFGDRKYADFFVGAREAIPKLLAEIRRLRMSLESIRSGPPYRFDSNAWEGLGTLERYIDAVLGTGIREGGEK